mmetsp:Transcript_412/g.373  ORF Transcript_412/g.373 Transcript_412/m.373 type:complete len:126 (-) Transcript_412:302-679(-)
MNVYRHSRERIPVFPLEWLCIQNIINSNKVDLDLPALTTLRDTYKTVYLEEIKSRLTFEGELKKLYAGSADSEQKALSHFSLMKERNEIDEVTFQCKFCTDFCYVSCVSCSTCNKPKEAQASGVQ